MTSDEIKAVIKHGLSTTHEGVLWEIAYQLAVQNEHLLERLQLDRIALTRNTSLLAATELGKRDADGERGEGCGDGFHAFGTGGWQGLCRKCGFTRQQLMDRQRSQPSELFTEAGSQQKNDVLSATEPSKRGAGSERGKCSDCQYWTPEPETARQVGRCWLFHQALTGSHFYCSGFTLPTEKCAEHFSAAAPIFQRPQRSEPSTEAESQPILSKDFAEYATRSHPADCSCPTCQFVRPL